MRSKENKLRKVIASIALWVFGATQILQWVAYANSFNIEWIDMSVINNSSSNNWGWTSWWWASWWGWSSKMDITYKMAQSALMSFTQQLVANWQKFILRDLNWDWVAEVISYKIAKWKQFSTTQWGYLEEITIYKFADWVYQSSVTISKVWSKKLSDFYVNLFKIKEWKKKDILVVWTAETKPWYF